jgi:pSer/pThr/pTyr-binding forkhead associated (FHA) protein
MVAIVQKVEPATKVEYSLMPLCPGARAIILAKFPVQIGRQLDVDIRLDDIFVSRRHCEIVAAESSLVVHDLGSKNGTFVNGIRTELSRLMPNDVLNVGRMEFVVRCRPAIAQSL